MGAKCKNVPYLSSLISMISIMINAGTSRADDTKVCKKVNVGRQNKFRDIVQHFQQNVFPVTLGKLWLTHARAAENPFPLQFSHLLAIFIAVGMILTAPKKCK